MSSKNFNIDFEPLEDNEFRYVGSYITSTLKMNVFIEKLAFSLSQMDCCQDCPTVVALRRALIVAKLFEPMTRQQRNEFLTRVDKADMETLIKYCVGFIDCQITLDNIESLNETEYVYLHNMNVLKHIYNVKQRYWSDD